MHMYVPAAAAIEEGRPRSRHRGVPHIQLGHAGLEVLCRPPAHPPPPRAQLPAVFAHGRLRHLQHHALQRIQAHCGCAGDENGRCAAAVM